MTIVAAGCGLVVKINLVLPDDLALVIVLTDAAHALVCDEVVAIVQLPDAAGITVRVRGFDGERDFLDNLALFVYLDNALVARLGDHGQAVFETLEPVDLDATGVGSDGLALPLPDHLLVLGHLDNLGWA